MLTVTVAATTPEAGVSIQIRMPRGTAAAADKKKRAGAGRPFTDHVQGSCCGERNRSGGLIMPKYPRAFCSELLTLRRGRPLNCRKSLSSEPFYRGLRKDRDRTTPIPSALGP